jgi:hypothetical protein
VGLVKDEEQLETESLVSESLEMEHVITVMYHTLEKESIITRTNERKRPLPLKSKNVNSN